LREAVARVLGAREQKGAIPLITRFSWHDVREPAASLRVLLVEDNAVNQRLASRLPEKKGDREKCLAGGMDAYLTKPIPPQELDELLENYLVRRAESTEAQASTLSKK
jgi:hypothetical protein